MPGVSDFIIQNGVLTKYIGRGGDVVIPQTVHTIFDRAFFGCKTLTAITIPGSVTAIGTDCFDGCTRLTRVTFPTAPDKAVAKAFAPHAALRVCTPNPVALPVRLRVCAALCFAEDGGLPTDPRYASHVKYIKANAAKLIKTAMENLPLFMLMCREKLIPAKEIEAYVEAAHQTADPEFITLALDYQNNKLTPQQKEKAAKRKERQEEAVFERAVARMDKPGISGLNFTVSGDLNTFATHSELKAFLESKGGCLLPALSVKTDFLIMNDPKAHSDKKKKADELGIEVITELEFNEKADRIFLIDENGTLTKYLGRGGDVVIPEGVKEIGDRAFYNCRSLTSVTIPEGVTKIGGWAFNDCHRLTSITIPESVTFIGNNAFQFCRSLVDAQGFLIVHGTLWRYLGKASTVSVPEGVTALADFAFCGCNDLTSITIPESVTAIGSYAFSGCGNLTCITIPLGVTEIDKCTFQLCKSLTEVTVPESVTGIGWWAFEGCASLKKLTILNPRTTIGYEALSGCKRLTVHAPAGSKAEAYAKEHKRRFVAE